MACNYRRMKTTLTQGMRLEIAKAYKAGKSATELAEEFNICPSKVRALAKEILYYERKANENH